MRTFSKTSPIVVRLNEPELIKDNTIVIHPKGFLRLAVTGAIFLLAAHLAGLYLVDQIPKAHISTAFNRIFNLDIEANAPSFFSSLLFLCATVLLYIISLRAESGKVKWRLLSFVFLFLCLDEAVSIHEETIYFMQNLLARNDHRDFNGYLHFAWVLPYMVLFLAVAAYYLKFVLNLPKVTRNLFIVSGIVYVAGAVGCEMIGGHFFKVYGKTHLWWIAVTFEEMLEISGLILFNYALLDYFVGFRVMLRFSKTENYKSNLPGSIS
jgi:hypothetical protein